jgi:hypothetical protein
MPILESNDTKQVGGNPREVYLKKNWFDPSRKQHTSLAIDLVD